MAVFNMPFESIQLNEYPSAISTAAVKEENGGSNDNAMSCDVAEGLKPA
jgi:hypothetical protein